LIHQRDLFVSKELFFIAPRMFYVPSQSN